MVDLSTSNAGRYATVPLACQFAAGMLATMPASLYMKRVGRRIGFLTGTALGIGYEIPLSCHRIFAADTPKARIGLPEILVGIFPGAGGTTRLIRIQGTISLLALLVVPYLIRPLGLNWLHLGILRVGILAASAFRRIHHCR